MSLLCVSVKPLPSIEEIPAIRAYLERSFPQEESLSYIQALMGSHNHPGLPRVMLARLFALSLLPSLLEYTGIPSEGLILKRDQHQRPYCTTGEKPARFDFNLSHSDAHAACALWVGDGRIGIDVEEPLTVERALPLVRRYCTDGEKAILQSLSSTEQAAEFTRMWTVREAMGKQAGGGMPLSYDSTRIPPYLKMKTGTLSDTGACITLCYPMKDSSSDLIIHSDSDLLLWH